MFKSKPRTPKSMEIGSTMLVKFESLGNAYGNFGYIVKTSTTECSC